MSTTTTTLLSGEEVDELITVTESVDWESSDFQSATAALKAAESTLEHDTTMVMHPTLLSVEEIQELLEAASTTDSGSPYLNSATTALREAISD